MNGSNSKTDGRWIWGAAGRNAKGREIVILQDIDKKSVRVRKKVAGMT